MCFVYFVDFNDLTNQMFGVKGSGQSDNQLRMFHAMAFGPSDSVWLVPGTGLEG